MARPPIGDIGPMKIAGDGGGEKERDLTWENICTVIRAYIDAHAHTLHRIGSHRIIEEGKEEVLVYNPSDIQVEVEASSKFALRYGAISSRNKIHLHPEDEKNQEKTAKVIIEEINKIAIIYLSIDRPVIEDIMCDEVIGYRKTGLVEIKIQGKYMEPNINPENRPKDEGPVELSAIMLRTAGLNLADRAQEIIGMVDPCLERKKLEEAIDEFEREAKL